MLGGQAVEVEIGLILVDDEAITQLNEQYRAVAGPTDVLSFPMWTRDELEDVRAVPQNYPERPVLLGDVWKQRYEDLIVVSPDVGGVVRARALAKRLESDLAIIDKRRPKANVSEVMNVIGEVKGRTCVIMDDMVDTAGTLVKAAQVLKEEGATKVVAYCTHAVLSGPAVERIAGSDLDELVVTDTIYPGEPDNPKGKIRRLTIAPLFGEAIHRIADEASVSSLFD